MLSDDRTWRVLAKSAVLCLSAGGRNKDINRAFEMLARSEPRHLLGLCARPGSPLEAIATKYEYVDFLEFALPSRKDGFLATNSLLAFSLLLGRAFTHMRLGMCVPPDMADLFGDQLSVSARLGSLRHRLDSVLDRDHLVVLHGLETQPAACDLESKFTEAALGAVMLSDYRNFAHGRHHWLAKRANTSGVIALAANADAAIAEKTMGLLPASIPSVVLPFRGDGVRNALASLVTGFFITALAGERRGIDPGKPGVPMFGRRLYHLSTARMAGRVQEVKMPLRRKALACDLPDDGLSNACKKFVRSMEHTSFSAIVLDYDGTLCGHHDRFRAMDPRLGKELVRILRAGVPIGIATGRGKSVRKALREALPQPVWERVVVGYYNGGECKLLSDASLPCADETPCDDLAGIAAVLKQNTWLCELADIAIRPRQLSIEPKNISTLNCVWAFVEQTLHSHGMPNVAVVRSDHSVDLLASGVSKRSVIQAIRGMEGSPEKPHVLCIGDQGKWPGNDWSLLSVPFSLSVDEVSVDATTCWNLAPAGCRGPQGALFYLSCLVPRKGRFTVNVRQLQGARR